MPTDRKDARAALERELRKAARSAGLTHDAARSVAADVCRLDGGGGEMAVKELLATLNDRDRERMRHLTAALRRLEAGEYGTCEACGGSISDARLDIMPEAMTCVQCAA